MKFEEMPHWTWFSYVKQSSSSPGPPAPCLHNKNVALMLSPKIQKEHHNEDQIFCLSHTHSQTRLLLLWRFCGLPVVAEEGRESTGWVPQASYRRRGRWPSLSPTHRLPCSSHSPAIHTENCREHRKPRCFMCTHRLLSVSVIACI